MLTCFVITEDTNEIVEIGEVKMTTDSLMLASQPEIESLKDSRDFGKASGLGEKVSGT